MALSVLNCHDRLNGWHSGIGNGLPVVDGGEGGGEREGLRGGVRESGNVGAS